MKQKRKGNENGHPLRCSLVDVESSFHLGWRSLRVDLIDQLLVADPVNGIEVRWSSV